MIKYALIWFLYNLSYLWGILFPNYNELNKSLVIGASFQVSFYRSGTKIPSIKILVQDPIFFIH